MLTWDGFFDRFVNLRMEFQLASDAIGGWAKSQEALDHYAQDQLEDLRGYFKDIPKEDAWVFSNEERISSYLEQVKKTAPQRTNDVLKRLNQHQYILLVTLIENMLKSVHEEVLRANPKLLRHDRPIPLGMLVAEGQEAIVGKEIEREVHSLDRKNAKERYEYFRDKLRINWFDGTIVPLLEGTLELRNHVLHENPDHEVNEGDLLIATLVAIGLTFATLAGAAAQYPTVCALPMTLTEDEARKYFVVQ